MLDAVLRFSLKNRLMIVAASLALLVMGSLITTQLPIDVLPNLTRPRVVLITECPGLAPEEVELEVTFPLETAILGATGVEDVRSYSDIGLSVINVEFGWDMDVYVARQIVQERIATVAETLPEGIRPQMGPISSLLGQILIVGMWYEEDEERVAELGDDLATTTIRRWDDPQWAKRQLDLRTTADWVVRQRLLTVPGIAQVITMGGGRKQYQVLVDLHALHKYEVTLHDVEGALRASNQNVTGGYVDDGSREYLIRGIGRVSSISDLERVVVRPGTPGQRSLTLGQVANVIEGPQVKRGDASVNAVPAVVLTIQKQPGADTRQLTDAIQEAIDEIRPTLPKGIRIDTTYEQREFIDYGIENVVEALRDGVVLVLIILTLFLWNWRTTCITLTAIPLSVVTTGVIFYWFDLSINVMTLGGIAVAMGELVDDAIVDVENIYRRLKENAQKPEPSSPLVVVYRASMEVRSSIVIGTLMVVLVFLPLFSLSGMEGRLFVPLGIAYIVSILASLLVSLSVTPVLSYYLLPQAKGTHTEGDPLFLRGLKTLAKPWIHLSLSRVGLTAILIGAHVAVIWAGITTARLGKDFLPPFDEGAAQLNFFLPPGTSLDQTQEVSRILDARLRTILQERGTHDAESDSDAPPKPIVSFTCKIGRAEQDEHVMGVNVSEYILRVDHESGLTREELIEALHDLANDVPGIEHEVEQPIAHLISHMLSGVTAQIAIKIFGEDLAVLRRKAEEVKSVVAGIPGIAEPVVEQQAQIPQLRIEPLPDQLATYGINSSYVNEFVETAMNGRVLSNVFEGQRSFDLLIRLDEADRRDITNLERLPLELPDGRHISLGTVARIREGAGPNTVARENARRRIVVRVNTLGRDVGSAVEEIQRTVAEQVPFDEGYSVVYGGQFEARRSATQRILLLSVVALAGICLVLYASFPSTRIVFQILFALPAAFVGGVLALVITGQTLSVAGMVGFISLGGIAARNGILLVSHYLHLTSEMGFQKEAIVRGSLERLAPVLMTALTTGIGLVPLVIGGQLPGKEILYPVATVILGGLMTSTLAEFLVRPGLFWFLSAEDADRLARAETQRIRLQRELDRKQPIDED